MAQIQITTRVTDNRQVLLSGKRYADYFGRLANRRVREAVEGARDELKIPAPEPTYPINWDSEKQRHAFFATNGFGHGIPYERTGAYTDSFRVQQVELRAYTLINRVPYTRYVGGDPQGQRQSRIHRGRWPLIRDVIARWAREMLTSVNADLRNVIRGEGIGL